MARLLVVTLLADGLLQARELERLARANAYDRTRHDAGASSCRCCSNSARTC
ncbi:MAG: hypothetical protein MZW92_60710 [Comamonadaceae bacterium]|nr:hypothetical protein [Comamonadaceae bacterium]